VLSGGIFNVIGIGVHARYEEYLGFGIDYQFSPIGTSDFDVSLSLLTLNGRFYPFAGSFFLTGGFAWQWATLETKTSTPTGNATLTGDISIPAIMLGLGFMGHDGFVMGIDLALGIPLGDSDADITVKGAGADDDAIQGKIDKLNDVADTFVNLLPVTFQLNLLRIGYLF
jgi:hypothetical protein